MREKRCKLCNKPYEHHYSLFGRGCLENIYKLFNYSQRFDEIIKEFQNIKVEELDEKIAKDFIERLSFIFDKTKISNPISYAVFYSMQYMFWQVVVVGGLLANLKLSAKLLNNSLAPIGKEPSDLIIDDEKTIKLIKESKAFKGKIKELAEKYGQDGKFNLNDYKNADLLIRFDDSDLLYALHDATMFVNAIRNEDNTWNLEIEINDTYDFTDFKNLKEYVDSNETYKDIFEDIFSTLLNNFGVVSSEYGVIKTYDLKIKFKLNPYRIE